MVEKRAADAAMALLFTNIISVAVSLEQASTEVSGPALVTTLPEPIFALSKVPRVEEDEQPIDAQPREATYSKEGATVRDQSANPFSDPLQ